MCCVCVVVGVCDYWIIKCELCGVGVVWCGWRSRRGGRRDFRFRRVGLVW